MSLESLLARLRADPCSNSGVSQVSGVQPYGGAASARYPTDSAGVSGVSNAPDTARVDTPDTRAKLQGYQRESYGQAACTPDTPDTPQNEEPVDNTDAAHWLADVARHLDTTPGELLAAGVILRDEVPHYLDRDPRTLADTIRSAHPARFTTREPDDRRHCVTCANLAGNRCRARSLYVMDDLPRRCTDYAPLPDDPDQRHGRERWPSLLTPMEATP